MNKLAAAVLHLDQAATPGPWRFEIRPSETFGRLAPVDIADSVLRADGELIAAYRTAAPDLAREVLRLQEALEASREGRKMECDELERQLRQCQGELLILRTAAQRAANDRARIERERDALRAAPAPEQPPCADCGAPWVAARPCCAVETRRRLGLRP